MDRRRSGRRRSRAAGRVALPNEFPWAGWPGCPTLGGVRRGAGPRIRVNRMNHPTEAAPLVAVFDEWAPRKPNSEPFHGTTLHRLVKENGVRSAKPLILSSEVPTLRKSRRVGQPLSWRCTKRSKTMCGPAPLTRANGFGSSARTIFVFEHWFEKPSPEELEEKPAPLAMGARST